MLWIKRPAQSLPVAPFILKPFILCLSTSENGIIFEHRHLFPPTRLCWKTYGSTFLADVPICPLIISCGLWLTMSASFQIADHLPHAFCIQMPPMFILPSNAVRYQIGNNQSFINKLFGFGKVLDLSQRLQRVIQRHQLLGGVSRIRQLPITRNNGTGTDGLKDMEFE